MIVSVTTVLSALSQALLRDLTLDRNGHGHSAGTAACQHGEPGSVGPGESDSDDPVHYYYRDLDTGKLYRSPIVNYVNSKSPKLSAAAAAFTSNHDRCPPRRRGSALIWNLGSCYMQF